MVTKESAVSACRNSLNMSSLSVVRTKTINGRHGGPLGPARSTPAKHGRTHLHFVLVDKACWCGAVARSTISAIFCVMVRATRRLMTSPTTIPLTPPFDVVKAMSRPERTMSTTILGDLGLCQTGPRL